MSDLLFAAPQVTRGRHVSARRLTPAGAVFLALAIVVPFWAAVVTLVAKAVS